MRIHTDSRRKKLATIEKLYPDAVVIDVTSKGEEPWVRFSPFYPHGGIPVPGSELESQSVEGLWQALKVFESEGVDLSKLDVVNMKGIKRSVRTRGKVRGHKFEGGLLEYIEARWQIYLPAYRWVLEERLQDEVNQLKEMAKSGSVVLLDYETNGDVKDSRKPLSHASLVSAFVRDDWPTQAKKEEEGQ